MTTAIVFGVLLDDGWLEWPGRNQLMIALAEQVPVVMLERSTPTQKLVVWRKPTIRRVEGQLHVMTDTFALRSSRLGRRVPRIAAAIDGRWFRDALRQCGFDDYLFWLTVADPTLAIGVPRGRLVYDCMDPNFIPEFQAGFDRDEFKLARRAKVVFASAGTLFERMRAVNASTYLLPNATNALLEARATGDLIPARPAGLQGRSGPVVGYMGTVDWRFDAEPVLAAARALPGATFAIVGRVNTDQEKKVAALRVQPNVLFLGQVSATAGEELVRSFDVGIIPFTEGPMNDAINPVKMYMYLAMGIPVVSTWIAEGRANKYVIAARGADAFADAVRAALNDDDDVAAGDRRNFARENTWRDRADAALVVLGWHELCR